MRTRVRNVKCVKRPHPGLESSAPRWEQLPGTWGPASCAPGPRPRPWEGKKEASGFTEKRRESRFRGDKRLRWERAGAENGRRKFQTP